MKFKIKKFNKIKILIILVLLCSLILSGAACGKKTKPPTEAKIKLVYWKVFDDKEIFDPIIEAFKEENPTVDIIYEKKDYQTYKQDIINALAANAGPDIISIKNDWIPFFADKVQPLDEKGMINQNYIMNEETFKKTFPPVVADDAIINHKIYGMPLSMDTLVLYYNRDIFQQAEIDKPPATWTEFTTAVKKIKRIGKKGVALGTVSNISNAPDIIYLLMLQYFQANNADLINTDKQRAIFNLPVTSQTGRPIYPGRQAIEFYTSFANPHKPVYTWNDHQPQALDAFAKGKVAMIFGYSWQQSYIEKVNPYLDYEIAPMPQISVVEEPVNYASYWVETVTKDCPYPEIAWSFINFIITKQINVYLQTTKKFSPILEDIKTSSDPSEYQSATAKNWYKKEPEKVEAIFRQLIKNIVNYNQPVQRSLDRAAADVTKILQTPWPKVER